MKKKEIDYTKLTDEELKAIVYAKTGGIPYKAVQEHQRRFPQNYRNRTITSNDF